MFNKIIFRDGKFFGLFNIVSFPNNLCNSSQDLMQGDFCHDSDEDCDGMFNTDDDDADDNNVSDFIVGEDVDGCVDELYTQVLKHEARLDFIKES